MAFKIIRSSDSAEADFVTLDPRNPNTSRPVVEPLSRPNVDGLAFRVLANKGRPYQWIGMRNFKNIYSARTAVDVLRGNIVGQLVTVDTNSQLFERLMVLEVEEVAARAIVVGSGGLTIATDGLWETNIGSETTPAIAVIAITVVHVGEVP